MKRIILFILCLVVLPEAVFARTRIQGFCQGGGVAVTIPGTQGSGSQRFQQSYRNCTITLYYPGTTTLVPANNVYSTELGSVKGNPFTAAGNAMWFAYVDEPDVDVSFSGGGIVSPYTMGHYIATPSSYLGGFGGRCDGTTNDYSALNAAALAMAAAGGGTLVIPAGKTCVISANIALPASVDLAFEAGGKLNANNATITIGGTISAPLGQIFIYTGTGAVVFNSNKSRIFYPEWWGAIADSPAPAIGAASGTDNLNAFRRASRAMPSGAILQFQAGAYYASSAPYTLADISCPERIIDGVSQCLGLLPIIKSGITVKGAGRGITWIRGTTTVWDATHPERTSLVYFNAAYPSSTCNVECVLHDIAIEDISFEDLNNLQATGFFGDFGPSMATFSPSYGIRLSRTEWLNAVGNSAIQGFGTCPTDTVGGCDGSGLIIEDTWIHSDGRPHGVSTTTSTGTYAPGNQFYISFSPINVGNYYNQRFENNIIEGDFGTSAMDSNPHNNTHLSTNFRFINNTIDDLGISPQMHPNGAHGCINSGIGDGIYILNNTCTFSATSAYGIMMGGEVPVGTFTGVKNLHIRGNTITAPLSSNPCINGLGGSLTDNAFVENNKMHCATPATNVTFSKLQRFSFSNNEVMREGADLNGILQTTTDVAALNASAAIRVFGNSIVSLNAPNSVLIVNMTNSPNMKNTAFKFGNNQCVGYCTDNYVGTPNIYTADAPTIANGATLVLTPQAVLGAMFGDKLTVLGLIGDTLAYAAWPAGLQINGVVTAADTVNFVVINNSGSSVTLNLPMFGGNGRFKFLIERPN